MRYLYPFLRFLDEQLLPFDVRIRLLPGITPEATAEFVRLPDEQRAHIADALTPQRPGEGHRVLSLQAQAARHVRRNDINTFRLVIPQTLFPILLREHPYWVATLLGILVTRFQGGGGASPQAILGGAALCYRLLG